MHMHFTTAIAIFIPSILTPSVVGTLMVVSPGRQTGINAALIALHLV
jgi:hypothetical protein